LSPLRIYLYAFVSMSFWALSFVWYKDAFISYGPVTIILFRLIISVSILGTVSLLIRKKLKLQKGDFKLLAALAFFEPFCYFMGEGYGMQYVSPTTGAIIISTIPLLTPFFLAMTGKKENISILNFAGMGISFAGIIMVVTGGDDGIVVSFKGVALLFVAVISAIFFSIVLKDVGKKYESMVIVFWQNLLAAIMFAPLFIILEMQSFLSSGHDLKAVEAVLKLGIFPSTVSFLLFIPVVSFLGAVKANMFANMIPVVTALFSFMFYGEEFGMVKSLGVVIAVSGLFVSQMKMSGRNLKEV